MNHRQFIERLNTHRVMVDFVDLSHHGYRIERELGSNRFGGRATFLATDVDLGQRVVVKQFQFTQRNAHWSEYDFIKCEMAILRNLKHPGIPRYLKSCQTADGFCIIQEYKLAESLAESYPPHYSPRPQARQHPGG